MDVSVDELRLLERLHVKAWPAVETAKIYGWLWRYSGGGSQRANSVSTVDFTGDDPVAALEEVEARYRAKGAPARVHTFDASAPGNVGDLMRARGYRTGDTTLTMVKPVGRARLSSDVDISEAATVDWRDVYLGAITPNRRAVNARILDTIPRPRAFFACRRGGNVISTGLGVADGGLAVVECMATRLEARRQGGAEAVLRTLECWAGEQGVRMLGLQVVATNAPGLALYGRCGFTAVATNEFWVRD
jgi:N-acetylglutamate synthase